MSNDAERPSKRLAVLIDADNASPKVIEGLLTEIAALGSAVVKRIYGDFTQQNLGTWKAPMADHAIQPIQQFRNTIGKNASDSALIIDAMDLLHARGLDGFCLVTSDSDFTRLATRIREDGLIVYGFGERKTPRPFVAACDRFIYTELFRQTAAVAPAAPVGKPAANGAAPAAEAPPVPKGPPSVRTMLDQAYDAVVGEDRRAQLGRLGQHIQRLMPDFDPRTYGCKRLSDLVEKEPGYSLVREPVTGGGALVFVMRETAKVEEKPAARPRRAAAK